MTQVTLCKNQGSKFNLWCQKQYVFKGSYKIIVKGYYEYDYDLLINSYWSSKRKIFPGIHLTFLWFFSKSFIDVIKSEKKIDFIYAKKGNYIMLSELNY